MEHLTTFLVHQLIMLVAVAVERVALQEQGLVGVLVEEEWVVLITLHLMQHQVAQILEAVVEVAVVMLVETVATAALA